MRLKTDEYICTDEQILDCRNSIMKYFAQAVIISPLPTNPEQSLTLTPLYPKLVPPLFVYNCRFLMTDKK